MVRRLRTSLDGLVPGRVTRGLEGVMCACPLLLLLACASSPSGASRLDRVPSGQWGGEHVRLTVGEAGATVEFDCAHGTLDEPLVLDASGHFDVKGSLVGEAGPIRKDDAGSSRPARYRGHTDGEHMTLEVTVDEGESAGTFSLAKGGSAKLVKCR
jgi:hypothetical protein